MLIVCLGFSTFRYFVFVQDFLYPSLSLEYAYVLLAFSYNENENYIMHKPMIDHDAFRRVQIKNCNNTTS